MGGDKLMTELVLNGINGGNPLGFMATLGTLLVMRTLHSNIKLSWVSDSGVWQPVVHGGPGEKEQFLETLLDALRHTSLEPFEIDKKLPFPVDLFISKLKAAQDQARSDDRRTADLMAAYGTEIHHDKGVFEDTSFRMARSGDSDGNGLPAYAVVIRQLIDANAFRRTLFETWSYQDDGPILRWDPIEDQRYALVWNNPSEKSKKQVKSMLGANALALESLALFPVVSQDNTAITTGFFNSGRREYFTWPIWIHPVPVDVVRSLLSIPELHRDSPNRKNLSARGVVEIYRCERIAPNKYYKNFASALPV